MKDINNEADSQFDSMMEILSDYGPISVIEAVQSFSVFVAEESDTCSECRDEALWLALELTQLLIKYARRFPPVESRITYHGNGRVQ
jgi:hypothetical protein